jgi:hypothetical protein
MYLCFSRYDYDYEYYCIFFFWVVSFRFFFSNRSSIVFVLCFA